jgi:peptidoglycan-N-acetylglucosamine deacetylase
MNPRLAAALTVPLLANALPGLASRSRPLRRALGIRDTIAGTGVALTFDDGPHPRGTVAVLERLEQAGSRATFFLAGEQVRRWPELAAEVASRGNDIGLHCHRHRLLARLTPRQVVDDMRRAAASIEDATARSPSLFRPPYGVHSLTGLVAASRFGWQPVHWTRDSKDWREGATAGSIVERATKGVQAGDIVLLHDADHYASTDCWQRTVAALPGLLRALDDRELSTELIG